MGRQFVEGFLAEGVDRDIVLSQHLQYNHYPPVSGDFIPACKEAIGAGECEEWDRMITLPNGKVRSASQIIEGLHLDSFLPQEEW